MIIATGDWAAVTRGMSSMAMVRAIRKSMPRAPAATIEPTIALGTSRKGFLASSAMLAAASKPCRVASPMIMASIRPPPTPK